jgi:DNA-binding SARP family transcriptional activator
MAVHPMEFQVLGPLEIVADGRPARIDAPKQRALLAVLLIPKPGPRQRRHSVDG